MSEFGDDILGDEWDEFDDDDLFDLLGDDSLPDTFVDDLVGTAWGHDPAWQPSAYDPYDYDDYFDLESGEDEYFDGELNPIDDAVVTTSTPQQSPSRLITIIRHDYVTSFPSSTKTTDPRKAQIEEKARKAMKGKKFYGDESEIMVVTTERHGRKRRKVESVRKGIVGIEVCCENEDEATEEGRGEKQTTAVITGRYCENLNPSLSSEKTKKEKKVVGATTAVAGPENISLRAKLSS